MLAGQTFREDAHLGPRPPVQVLDLGATATPESPEPGPRTWWDLMHGTAPAPHTQVQEEPSLSTLTDSGFRAGEAPVLGHHVGIVALAGQHLRHLRSPLPLPHLGLQENPEADVPSVRRELPPAGDMAPLTATCLGSGPLLTTRRCVCVGRSAHLSTQPGNRISLSTCREEPRPTVAWWSYCTLTWLRR